MLNKKKNPCDTKQLENLESYEKTNSENNRNTGNRRNLDQSHRKYFKKKS